MPLNLVLIGPPGCGKGTQALRLARRFRIPHISTGDILRQAVRDGTPLGREVAAIMAQGSLVGDSLIADLVRERLQQPDTRDGFILDGFPRTVTQARVLEEIVGGHPLVTVLISVPDDEIVKRLSTRRICNSCRLTQSVSEVPDPEAETCPYCGGRLVRRDDDAEETVRNRLATYASFARPVLEHYRRGSGFVAVDGLQQPDDVTRALFAAIDGTVQRLDEIARGQGGAAVE